MVKNHPEIKTAGGGFLIQNFVLFGCSSFWVFHYITLDDGEVPIEELIANIENLNHNSFKNFLLEDGK
jgi:hypothetical protein